MNTKMTGREDYDFIVRVIHYLDHRHGISFFITSRDFDVLYRWWEKRIPMAVLENSIAAVVLRRREKNKPIDSFVNFSYQVKKNFKAFLEMGVGGDESVDHHQEDQYGDIERFFERFPQPLAALRQDFQDIYDHIKKGLPFSLENLQQRLLELFAEDRELALKTEIFLKNLAPELRKPEIRNRYRLNYLNARFGLPDFSLYGEPRHGS